MKPQLLIVDDQESILYFLRKTLEAEDYKVATAKTGAEGMAQMAKRVPDVVLLDMKLPDRSGLDLIREMKDMYPQCCVIMMTAFGDVETSVAAMKRGAFDYVNKPIQLEELLAILDRAVESNSVSTRVHAVRRSSGLFEGVTDIVPSESPAMAEVYELIKRISVSDASTVLIQGESGVGKDVVANLIHRNSPREKFSMLDINCASLPEPLLESELFGHEKGAFTDAVNQKMGLMELANRGTLFLDEIGEMSLTIQVKLLRVLEKMAFRRVGGVKDIKVNVRMVCATNRDLRRSVEMGTFREDLFYRLNVIPLRVPPLRERPEDIPALAEHFLRLYSERFQKNFTRVGQDALDAMLDYRWPGNIRELKNLMERTVLMEDGNELRASHLPLSSADEDASAILVAVEQAMNQSIPPEGLDLENIVSMIERTLIEKAYRAADGNQSQTAKLLNLNRDKLRYRMKSFELL